MDKKIILAVAGSGKTTHIISKLTLDKRFLILTYTTNNVNTLRNGIIRKFSYFPENIKLQSYFVFLNSFCFKPLLSYRIKSNGINWKQPPEFTRNLKRTNLRFYLDKTNRLYHNRIAKLCETQNILTDINNRLEKYYDCLFVDEIQDFAGHDFNLLKSIVKANCEILFVGDFFQHTFNTSSDGKLNTGLFNDYEKYKQQFRMVGLIDDPTTLEKSHRCTKTICDFIKNNIGISISSATNRTSTIKVVNDGSEADSIINNNSIVKLFYETSYKYECYSDNWGNSKGINHFIDVCVILSKKIQQALDKEQLSVLNPTTKNKLYVACSRASNNLYFVPDKFVKKYLKQEFQKVKEK